MKLSTLLAIFFWVNTVAISWVFILDFAPFDKLRIGFLIAFFVASIFTTAIADSKPKDKR